MTASSVMRTLDDRSRSLQIKEGLDVWKRFQGQQAIINEQNAIDIEDQSHNSHQEFPDVVQLDKRHLSSTSQPTTQDFTTEGKHGQLGCPFASKAALRKRQRSIQMSQAQTHQLPDSLPAPPDTSEEITKDPIAVEFHAAEVASPPPSAAGPPFKCPIRFLDQHSPDEVAQYFENHKHEIPRSHEICVKRYQSNAESIRQLDAKYGNLVNMIQGLGMKHQPMLPTKEEEEDGAWPDHESIEKVEKWAATCTNNPGEAEVKTMSSIENRASHFDRPLKEIRVGESPSRPWGISVPHAADSAVSEGPMEDYLPETQSQSTHSKHLHGQSSVFEGAPSKVKYPFDHNHIDSSPPDASQSRHEKTESSNAPIQLDEKSSKSRGSKTPPNEHSRMLFTGPVFIGYPAEQAKALLQDYFQNMKPTSS